MYHQRGFGLTGLVAATAVFAAASVTSADVLYAVEDIGTLGGAQSAALDINDHGVVVGWSETVIPGETHAFVWERSRGFTDLGTLGGMTSEARAINARGEIVGVATYPDEYPAAFLVGTDGIMRDLIELLVVIPDYPTSVGQAGRRHGGGGLDCVVPLRNIVEANAISDEGFIAACGYLLTDDELHGLLLVPSPAFGGAPYTWVDLGSLDGANYCNASALNSFRQVVGHSGLRAFVWEYDEIRPLEYTVGRSAATAINDNGTIVGWTDETGTWPTAAMWRNNIRFDLTVECGYMARAKDINESELVVGWAAPDIGSPRQAVLWEGCVVRPLNEISVVPVRASVLSWDELTEATAIDDTGRIVGFGTSLKNGNRHAFMLIPIEPLEQ